MKKMFFFFLVLGLSACSSTSPAYEYEFVDEGGHQQIVSVAVDVEDGMIEKIKIDETFTTKNGETTTKKKLKKTII